MLIAYLKRETLEAHQITAENHILLKEAIWVDLLSPTKTEEKLVEQSLTLNIPTRDEMVEIETSSRLYKENDTLFMTASFIAQSKTSDARIDPITFVLTQQQLITIRYIEPHAFKFFIAQLPKLNPETHTALILLIELLEATVDRLADILERVGRRLDSYSKTIFRPTTSKVRNLDYQKLMREVGASGDLDTKARESLITLNRLVSFFGQSANSKFDADEQSRVMTLSKDIASLSDHANFLSTKVNFLLDATLGMVNIEQNNIIKIFSVAAVIFLPPTLIASIYGMNFHFIPELSWKYGYLFSIGLIILAAFLPYRYFKYRKWL